MLRPSLGRAGQKHADRGRIVRILRNDHLAAVRREVREGAGQVDSARGVLGAKGQRRGGGAVRGQIHAVLVDGLARGVAKEVVLRHDGHGGSGVLQQRLDLVEIQGKQDGYDEL